MTDAPTEQGLPPTLRLLKWLVIVLMITMIGGVITVVWLLVTRMPDMNALPALPTGLVLPEGTQAEAVTTGKGWIGVVTNTQQFLIFSVDGSLRQTIAIAP